MEHAQNQHAVSADAIKNYVGFYNEASQAGAQIVPAPPDMRVRCNHQEAPGYRIDHAVSGRDTTALGCDIIPDIV